MLRRGVSRPDGVWILRDRWRASRLLVSVNLARAGLAAGLAAAVATEQLSLMLIYLVVFGWHRRGGRGHLLVVPGPGVGRGWLTDRFGPGALLRAGLLTETAVHVALIVVTWPRITPTTIAGHHPDRQDGGDTVEGGRQRR